MTIKDLPAGKSATILKVGGDGALRQHFLDMGLIQGAEVTVIKYAPMGDPVELRIHSYELTIRLSDAEQIEVSEPYCIDNKAVVPFWLYDYSARTMMSANANKVRTTRRGDTEYTYTDHFDVYRDVSAEFQRIPADASEKMPDEQMDMLEPYNYSEITDFAMPYLSGYLSEKYNYTADEIQSRAKKRADSYITQIARDSITGYSSVIVRNNSISMNGRGSEYALLPVWMLNFRYNNKEFHFYLNGQTGKIVADRPISAGKAVTYGIGIFVLTLIITMIGGLLFI